MLMTSEVKGPTMASGICSLLILDTKVNNSPHFYVAVLTVIRLIVMGHLEVEWAMVKHSLWQTLMEKLEQ